MTIGELKEILKPYYDGLPVVIHYDLSDWPGEMWGHLQPDPLLTTPAEVTDVGNADPEAKTVSLIFRV